jgi:hypothetical protein
MALRNNNNAACRSGDAKCLGQAEVVFRTCLAGKPVAGAHFELLLFPKGAQGLEVMPLSDREATDADWNPVYNQIEPGLDAYMGTYWVPANGCTFYRTSDDGVENLSNQDLVCQAIQDVIASSNDPVWFTALGKRQYDLLDLLFANGLQIQGWKLSTVIQNNSASSLDQIQYLVRHGMPVDGSAVYVAVENRSASVLPIVHYLISKGAVLDQADLENAVNWEQSADVIRLLLENGAEPTGDEAVNKRISRSAAFRVDPQSAEMILNHGGDRSAFCGEAVVLGTLDRFRSLCPPQALRQALTSQERSCTLDAIRQRASRKKVSALVRGSSGKLQVEHHYKNLSPSSREYRSRYSTGKINCLYALGKFGDLMGEQGVGYVSSELLQQVSLTQAIRSANVKVMRYLLRHGTPVDYDAAQEAGRSGSVAIVSVLFDSGIHENLQKALCASAVRAAAGNGVLGLLVKKGALNSQTAAENLTAMAGAYGAIWSPRVVDLLLSLRPAKEAVKQASEAVQQELADREKSGPSDMRYAGLGVTEFYHYNGTLEKVAALLQAALARN